mmetsp:Transcript_8191/g.13787  ORF Transcript_8191/g.13787 Transcript_8191/m.13787 type:complete len:205 (-) Transcript_8191:863-1477(-)
MRRGARAQRQRQRSPTREPSSDEPASARTALAVAVLAVSVGAVASVQLRVVLLRSASHLGACLVEPDEQRVVIDNRRLARRRQHPREVVRARHKLQRVAHRVRSFARRILSHSRVSVAARRAARRCLQQRVRAHRVQRHVRRSLGESRLRASAHLSVQPPRRVGRPPQDRHDLLGSGASGQQRTREPHAERVHREQPDTLGHAH